MQKYIRRREAERPLKRCGALARSTGLPCQKWGMQNGRCRYHGGAAKRGFELSQTKHGRYSKYIQAAGLPDKYAIARNDEKLSDLDEELAIVQALIFDAVEKLDFHALDLDRLIALCGKVREESAPPAEQS